jgi:hypothetical protein
MCYGLEETVPFATRAQNSLAIGTLAKGASDCAKAAGQVGHVFAFEGVVVVTVVTGAASGSASARASGDASASAMGDASASASGDASGLASAIATMALAARSKMVEKCIAA